MEVHKLYQFYLNNYSSNIVVHETKYVNYIKSNTAKCITCTKFNKTIARCKKIYLVHGIQILSILGAANLHGVLHLNTLHTWCSKIYLCTALLGVGKSTWCTTLSPSALTWCTALSPSALTWCIKF